MPLYVLPSASVGLRTQAPAAGHAWKLYYPMGDDQMVQRYRLHYESLRSDPHVERVDCYDEVEHLPGVAILSVLFKGGWCEPEQIGLRHLNLVYKEPRLHIEPAARRLQMRTTPALPHAPEWVKTGSWVRNIAGTVFEILGVERSVGEIPVVMLRENHETQVLTLLLDAVLASFSPAPKPKGPLTAHQRLMSDDEY
jgi:hypothetical protein